MYWLTLGPMHSALLLPLALKSAGDQTVGSHTASAVVAEPLLSVLTNPLL